MTENKLDVEEENGESPVLTRYLYFKEEVKHSLLIALLNRQRDETLFWTYELYFSGFQQDTFELLFNIYQEIYSHVNSKRLGKYLHKLYTTWYENSEDDSVIGSIVLNLLYRKYDINRFITEYFKVKCILPDFSQDLDGEKPFLRIKMNCEDVSPYKTVNALPTKAYHILKTVSRYKTHKEVGNLFLVENVSEMENIYDCHWLYYASKSPIWMERILSFGGSVNDAAKSVHFENEDKEEEFYDLFNYETDEQSSETREKSIGNGNEKQLSIKDFAELYGGRIILKKIGKLTIQTNM